MTRRARGKLSIALVVAVIATTAVSVALNSRTTPSSHPTATTAWALRRGAFARGYVETDFIFAGALRVGPASREVEPTREEPVVARQIWATSQLGGYTPEHLGFGLVTIMKRAGGNTHEHRLAAWIGLAYRNPDSIQCPSSSAVTSVVHQPLAAGWAAIVVGDARDSPAVVYTAAYEACGHQASPSLVRASDVVSVPWAFAVGSAGLTSIVATVPACATVGGEGLGGSRTSSSGVQYVTVPESAPGSKCVGSRREVVRTALLAQAAPAVTHSPLGLVRQVAPVTRFTTVIAPCAAGQLRPTLTLHRSSLSPGGGFRASVTFTNTSSRCWIVNGVLEFEAVRGAGHVAVGLLGTSPSLYRPTWLVVGHGARAYASMGERWSHCSLSHATGLELLPLQPGWATRYFRLSSVLSTCTRGDTTMTDLLVSLEP